MYIYIHHDMCMYVAMEYVHMFILLLFISVLVWKSMCGGFRFQAVDWSTMALSLMSMLKIKWLRLSIWKFISYTNNAFNIIGSSCCFV